MNSEIKWVTCIFNFSDKFLCLYCFLSCEMGNNKSAQTGFKKYS
jgi:hypothetical protein